MNGRSDLRVHVLTEPPVSQNTAAFLSPIVRDRARLRARGVRVRLFYNAEPALTECDVVAINTKVWPGPWTAQRDGALRLIAAAQAAGRRVVCFDRTSSPGILNADVLRAVDRYNKGTIYRDRSAYTRSVYGGRAFADYYRRTLGIADRVAPEDPDPLTGDEAQKLEISWNVGLAGYALAGPRLASWFARVPLAAFMGPPRRFWQPSASRSGDVSCRMSTSYEHETVAWQRRQMAVLLSDFRRTDRIAKPAYMRELRTSKIVASPFGYSEINYKDFETFLSGAVLLKPDMAHLETWPDYYRPGETYVTHHWDLSDVRAVIAGILANYSQYLAVAAQGQALYRFHTADAAGRDAFADRFAHLVGAH